MATKAQRQAAIKHASRVVRSGSMWVRPAWPKGWSPVKVYVAGSVQDIERVRYFQQQVRDAGHVITHDWTGWGWCADDDDFDEAALAESGRQVAAIAQSDVVVLVDHARGKGKYIEVGLALPHAQIIIIPSSGSTSSLYYTQPNVHLIGHYRLADAIKEVTA